MRLAHLIILTLCLFFSSCQQTNEKFGLSEASTILPTIPKDDREILNSFFQLLLRDYDFAYTLFGKKPLSMACYPAQVNSWILHHPSEYLTFEKGWDSWTQYSSLFSSDAFVLKRCDDGNILEIFLINKQYALRAIENNITLFQEILGYHIDPQKLLNELCTPNKNIMETLNDHSGLLGILLGYGRENAMKFERKVNICRDLNTRMTPPFTTIHEMASLQPKSEYLVNLYSTKTFSSPEKIYLPSVNDVSMAEELNAILENENPFELDGSDFFLDQFIAPVFMTQGDDLETKQLHEKYLVTRQKVRRAYQQKPFLETTLNQWMHPQ